MEPDVRPAAGRRPGCPLRGPWETAREAKNCDLRPQKLQKSPRLAALAGFAGINFDSHFSEITVEAFLRGKIKFLDIAKFNEQALSNND